MQRLVASAEPNDAGVLDLSQALRALVGQERAEEVGQGTGSPVQGPESSTLPCEMPDSFVQEYTVGPTGQYATIAEARDAIAQYIQDNNGNPGPYLIQLAPDTQRNIHTEDPLAITRDYLRGQWNPSSPITIVIRSDSSEPVTWEPATAPTHSPLLWARDISFIVEGISFSGVKTSKAVLAVINGEVRIQDFTVYLKNCSVIGTGPAESDALAGLVYVQSDLQTEEESHQRHSFVCIENCEVVYARSGSLGDNSIVPPDHWTGGFRLPEWGGAISISGHSTAPGTGELTANGRYKKIAIVDSVSPDQQESPKYKGNVVLSGGNEYNQYDNWSPAGGTIGIYADFEELLLENLYIDGDSSEGSNIAANAVKGGGVFIATEYRVPQIVETRISVKNCKIQNCTVTIHWESGQQCPVECQDPRTCALGGGLCMLQSGGFSGETETLVDFSLEDCTFSHNRARIPNQDQAEDVTWFCPEMSYYEYAGGNEFSGCPTARGGAVALVKPSWAIETGFRNLTIQRTVFEENEAATAGGALFLHASFVDETGGQQPALTIEQVTASGNRQRVPSALEPGALVWCDFDVEGWHQFEVVYLTYPPRAGGGAFYLATYGSDEEGHPIAEFPCTVVDCTFEANRTAVGGGAVLIDGYVLPFDRWSGDSGGTLCPRHGHRGQWLFDRVTFINNSADAMITSTEGLPYAPQGHALYFARLPNDNCVYAEDCNAFDFNRSEHTNEPKWQVSNCYIRHDTWDVAHAQNDYGREVVLHGAPLVTPDGLEINLYWLGNTVVVKDLEATSYVGDLALADAGDLPEWPDDPGPVLTEWWGGYRILSNILWAQGEEGATHYGLYPYEDFTGVPIEEAPYSNDSQNGSDRIVLGSCIHKLPQYLAGTPPVLGDPENYESDPVLYPHGHIDHESPCINKGAEPTHWLIVNANPELYPAPFPSAVEKDFDKADRIDRMDSGADESQWGGFRRGEINQDGTINVADAVALLAYLFSGRALDCHDAGDVNDDGGINIADSVRLLDYLFGGQDPPPPPFDACGEDPTPDQLRCGYFNVNACP